MKALLLAGGIESRLFPVTLGVSKVATCLRQAHGLLPIIGIIYCGDTRSFSNLYPSRYTKGF